MAHDPSAISHYGVGRLSFQKKRSTRRSVIVCCFILSGLSGVVWSASTILLVTIVADTAWSQSAVAFTFGLFALVNAASAPLVGMAFRFADTRIVLAGLTLMITFGLVLAGMAQAEITFIIAVGLVVGVGMHALSSYALFALIVDRVPRGTDSAMAIADSGAGLAVFMGLPLTQIVIGMIGWRAFYIWIGVIIALVGLWLHLRILPPMRRIGGPDRPQARHGWGAPAPIILILAACFLFGPAANQALQLHQVAIFQTQGIPLSQGVWFASAAGFAIFLVRLSIGMVIERLGYMTALAGGAAGAVVAVSALLLLVLGAPPWILAIYSVAFGVGFGSQTILLASAARRVIARQRLAVGLGILRMVSGFGMLLGATMMAFIYDLTASYLIPVIVVLAMISGKFLGLWFVVGTSK